MEDTARHSRRLPYPPKNAKRCMRAISRIMAKGEAAIMTNGDDGKLMAYWAWYDYYRGEA